MHSKRAGRQTRLENVFIFSCFSLTIIIKQGPESMIYYSFFNPLDMQAVVWTFLHPVQQSTLPEAESQNNFCSAANFLSGSANQETKDINSPTIRNFQSASSADNNSKPQPKSNRNRKIKQKDQEDEFKPNAPEIKKSRKTPQNANRNVVPNIMHQVISFLQKRSKSGNLVEKFISSADAPEKCRIDRFYNYQRNIKDKLNHYVNADSLSVLKDLQQPSCEVYSELEQRYYNKISRLLVQYFLKREFDTIILTSKRVNSDKKFDHLSMKRKILEQISEKFNE